MNNLPILVVDDEKNIRMTMSQSLEPLGLPVETAVNGEEALSKLHSAAFGLVFLDLKMPGLDGMEVLRIIRRTWPKLRVIIITAHGSIDSAVEAMKLGAVDFIQKPFSPGEIRDLARRVFEREDLDADEAVEYGALIELAKRHITDDMFEDARAAVKKAIAEDPGHPEAYNLLGALFEIDGDHLEAVKFYHAAMDIDPTFKTAGSNLERITSWRKYGPIDYGPDAADTEQAPGGESDEQ
ncbi:MAG: response regulator [Desulfovibrionaceae bacterium]|nr:response regulator [Desulfovibrionaceae bacterium]